MNSRYFYDSEGTPLGFRTTRRAGWTPEALALLEIYLRPLPPSERRDAGRSLRHAAERAARRQQYPAITITTLRAQIALGAEKQPRERPQDD